MTKAKMTKALIGFRKGKTGPLYCAGCRPSRAAPVMGNPRTCGQVLCHSCGGDMSPEESRQGGYEGPLYFGSNEPLSALA